MRGLWITHYRPKTLDEYVWPPETNMRSTVEGWLADKALPHCLFSGHHGCGKTSLALLLLDLLEIPDSDILQINASRERKVEDMQNKVIQFLEGWAMNPTGKKYVFMDEADRLTPHAQDLLRSEMETWEQHCRFILTCNDARKIIRPLHSRLQEIVFSSLDQDQYMLRAIDVLNREKVQYDVDVLAPFVHSYYPDLRKLLGTLQQYTRDGVLQPIAENTESTKEYLDDVVALFRKKRYLDGRRLLIERADPDEYIDIFRYFYKNISMFGEDTQKQDEALLVIRDAMLAHPMAADQEINMAAMLAQLTLIGAN